MKKAICGFLLGMAITSSMQICLAEEKWNKSYRNNINDICRTIDITNEKLDKIYSKMKSIDERLEIENKK